MKTICAKSATKLITDKVRMHGGLNKFKMQTKKSVNKIKSCLFSLYSVVDFNVNKTIAILVTPYQFVSGLLLF